MLTHSSPEWPALLLAVIVFGGMVAIRAMVFKSVAASRSRSFRIKDGFSLFAGFVLSLAVPGAGLALRGYFQLSAIYLLAFAGVFAIWGVLAFGVNVVSACHLLRL